VKKYSMGARGVYEALPCFYWWVVKMILGQSCRVFECVVHITRDKLRVIQVSLCNIAGLGGQSNAV